MRSFVLASILFCCPLPANAMLTFSEVRAASTNIASNHAVLAQSENRRSTTAKQGTRIAQSGKVFTAGKDGVLRAEDSSSENRRVKQKRDNGFVFMQMKAGVVTHTLSIRGVDTDVVPGGITRWTFKGFARVNGKEDETKAGETLLDILFDGDHVKSVKRNGEESEKYKADLKMVLGNKGQHFTKYDIAKGLVPSVGPDGKLGSLAGHAQRKIGDRIEVFDFLTTDKEPLSIKFVPLGSVGKKGIADGATHFDSSSGGMVPMTPVQVKSLENGATALLGEVGMSLKETANHLAPGEIDSTSTPFRKN